MPTESAMPLEECFHAAYSSCEDLFRQDDYGDLTRYSEDPVGFCRDILGVRLWRKQKEVLEDLVRFDRVSVRSCHGAGKTRAAACSIVWGILTHRNSIIVTTAPTWNQVEELLWPEVHDIIHNARYKLPGRLLETSYQLGPKWKALGRSTNKPERFAGFHATPIHDLEWELSDEEFWAKTAEEARQSSFMMLVVDEASGVDEKIYEVSAGFMTTTGSKMFLIGNPSFPGGYFYSTHNPSPEQKIAAEAIRKAVNWKTHHISYFDLLDEAPRLANPDYVERARFEWGEGSPMWQVRVLGEFPQEGPDALFPIYVLEASTRRDEGMDSLGLIIPGMEKDNEGNYTTRTVFGIDVGAHGGAETVVYVRRGGHIVGLHFWKENDTLKTIQRIIDLITLYQPEKVNLDRGNIGKGVMDSLLADPRATARTAILGIDFGSSASDPVNYVCLRDETYHQLAQVMRRGELTGLEDDKTKAQLCPIRYKQNARQKIQVQPKDELTNHADKSPDRADALAICFIGYKNNAKSGRSRPPQENPKGVRRVTTPYTLNGPSPW